MTRRVAALSATAAIGLYAVAAQAQGPANSYPAVTQPEQAARDKDRARILNDELMKEQSRATEAIKRRGERLAAKDLQGVAEAEAAQQRAASSIAALKREIELVVKSSGSPKSPAASRVTASGTPREPLSSVEAPTTPWWDVYSKAPRRGESVASRQVSAAGDHTAVAAERPQ